MKLHSFQDLVTRVINLSTRDGRPLSIRFGGNEAYTTESLVQLPALPAGTFLTPHEFSIFFGYAIHEGPGHQTHSDLKLYIDTNEKKMDPVFSQILNILEDVRIENLDIKKYPGDEKYLNAVHQFLDDKIPIERHNNPSPIGLIYKEAFKNYRNLDTKRLQGELSTLYPTIATEMSSLPLCQSTKDCISLAEKITKLLKDQSNAKEKNDEKSNPSPKGDKNSARNGGPSSNPSELPPDETNPSPSDNTEHPDSIGDFPFPAPGDEEEGIEPGDDPPSSLSTSAQEWEALTEVKNLIESLVQTISSSNSFHDPQPHQSPLHTGDSIFPPADLSLDRIFVPSEENLPLYLYTRSSLAPQITALKKMFRIHLQAKKKSSWLRGLEDGETLDRERLHVTALNQTSIFKEKRNKRLINTAVELLLDLSGSMYEELVRSSAIVLAEALSAIPEIKLSICGFKTNEKYSHANLPGIGRLQGMDILLFKDYSEPYNKARAKLGAIKTQGGTPLGCAYGKALERILFRPEPRRVLFLITDGSPSFHKADQRHSDYLLMETIHKKCKRLGIETLGLGIGPEQTVSFLKLYVDKCERVQNISSLPQTLLQILKGVVR